MNKSPPFFIFLALFSILFMVIFNYTLTIMASLYIVGELGGSHYITTYTIIFYSLGNALGVPLGYTLANRFGSSKLLTHCLLLFAVFSWLCAISPTYFLFIFFRFMQGFVSGPFYILVSRFFGALTPENRKKAFTVTTLTIFTVVPVIGACWGGWIAYDYHWRWFFYINLPIILVLAWVSAYHLKKYDEFPIIKTPFDIMGYFFYFVGIFCLTFVAATGQEFDWFRSPLLIVLTLIGTPCFIFFILWTKKHPHPVLDLLLLKKFAFSFSLINLSLLFSAYFGMILLLALWLSLYVDYTPIWIGVLIGNMAVAGVLPALLVGDKYGKMDCRVPLLISIVCFAFSSFHTSFFNVDINFERVASSRIFAGFGLAFFLPPLFRLCFHSYPEEKTPNVVAIFQSVRAISCGLGASLYVILWQRRQVFYHDRLGGQLTDFSQQTKTFFSKANFFHIDGLKAKAQLNELLDRQATALALDDCFYFMGWIFVGLLVLLACTLFFRSDHFFPEKQPKIS